MHNMIIKDECGQDLNNHVYDLMGHQCGRYDAKNASTGSLRATMIFTTSMCMMIFRRISSRSGGHRMTNKGAASFHVLYVMNCILCVMNFE
jgi:hypothetical protein